VAEAERKVQSQETETVANAGPESDLMDALKESLEQERMAREQLDELLRQTQTRLMTNQTTLAEREQQIQENAEKLARQEEEARRMAAEQALLQKKLEVSREQLTQMQQEYDTAQNKMAELQQKYSVTQATLKSLEDRYESTQSSLSEMQQKHQASAEDIEALKGRLASAQSEARVNQQLVQELEKDLRQRVTENASLQQAVQQLDQERQVVLAEKTKLAGELQVVATEQRMTREQLVTAREEIQTVREEKAVMQEQATKLAENVSDLANQSEKITEEIRQARPLTPNSIFSQYTSNRIESGLLARRTGVFGQKVKKQATLPTILFTDGKQSWVVYHVKETPFEFSAIGTEWEAVSLSLQHGNTTQALTQLAFLDRDPRILIAPVTDQQVAQLKSKVYEVSKDLFQFEEAVLVGAKDNYYGECAFQIDPETPGYMRMQRERFGRLFGKFVPSRGDLVFTKTGDLVGIMANKEYCLVFDQLKAGRTLKLGSEVPKQLLAAYFSQMYFQLEDMPFRLR
jgi:hypothetical protein